MGGGGRTGNAGASGAPGTAGTGAGGTGRGAGTGGSGGIICGTPVATNACEDCMAAGGTCNNGTCTFACGTACNPCTGDIKCPKGMACSIDCPASGCPGAIDCRDATSCTVRCGDNACAKEIQCGGSPCTVTCYGTARARAA